MIELKRYEGNPIIAPNPRNPWEAKATFNPGIIRIGEKTYILYRAMSMDNTSTIGLAVSSDGFVVEERLSLPVYAPRKYFEMKLKGEKNTGCEDPRVTLIDDRIFMCYTAVGESGPFIKVGKVKVNLAIRVALTSIALEDFLGRNWSTWEEPKLISPPGTWDKDACILERKVEGRFVFFHRIFPNIWIDSTDDLSFKKKGWVCGYECMSVRKGMWDDDRVGIGGPPIPTEEGWVLIYHGRSSKDGKYRLGAALLSKENPAEVVRRLEEPILEPEEGYEESIVFSCGQAVVDDTLYLYYGAADKYVAVATCRFSDLLSVLVR